MAYISFKPKAHFNTVTFTGTGSSNSVTGVGFRPDWLWIKNRSTTASHIVQDVVRGATKQVYPDLNNSEVTGSDGVSSFDSDGFTVGTGASFNGNGNGIVAWSWLAGGSHGSANTNGTINTTYTSVNSSSGFSISKYTGNGSQGATVGHGLGAAPQFIAIKSLDSANNWAIGTGKYNNASNPWDYYVELNDYDARAENYNRFANVAPSSTVFSIGSSGAVNTNTENYIAYCFLEKTGFSKFGIYFGNGNADGSFIYTGFKPAFVMIKQETGNQGWMMHDNKRNNPSALLGNTVDATLYPSQTAAEATSGFDIDFYSNGFKPRNTDAAHNANNNSYVYWAFAEEPLVSSNNIPATAR